MVGVYTDFIESLLYINFNEDFGFTDTGKGIVNKGDRILIFFY